MKILYRAGKENSNADALSRSPYLPAPAVDIAEDEVQVSALIAGSSGGRTDQRYWGGRSRARHLTLR